jgi:hypothetical protein
MRYMARLRDVVDDAVGLIEDKSQTYKDSWKRRGGAGAWFTVVRPWDRLETIVARHGGDIFAAIAADPFGADGSALACVRDVMNYMILTEAECRTSHGVGPHGPERPMPIKTIEEVRVELGLLYCDHCGEPRDHICVSTMGHFFCGRVCAEQYVDEQNKKCLQVFPTFVPGTPEDGGHHAAHCEECDCAPGHPHERFCSKAPPAWTHTRVAGEVTQDSDETASTGPSPRRATIPVTLGGFGDDRRDEFARVVRETAALLGLEMTVSWDKTEFTLS